MTCGVEVEPMRRVVESETRQCDYPNCFTLKPLMKVARTSIIESHRQCLLGHWYVYECLFLTLVFVLMTVIIMIVYMFSAP